MKKIIVSLLILIVCSGCFSKYVHVPDRYPIYEIPPKAQLENISITEFNQLNEKTRSKILKTVTELKLEAAQLRVILESYNKYAADKNKQYEDIR